MAASESRGGPELYTMAKSKKSPTSSRFSKPRKAKGGLARNPKVLAAAIATLNGKGKRGRKWKGGMLTETALDAVAAGKGRVEAPAPAAPAKLPRMLSDPRLPAVGETIVRTYKGKEYRVTRLEDRFTFEGRDYPSLSKIAREIIGGAQVNGFAFFGLVPKAEKASS